MPPAAPPTKTGGRLSALARQHPVVLAGGAAVVGLGLYTRAKKGSSTNPGTTGASSGLPSSTPYALPTADTTANDVYNALYDNLISKLGQASAGAGSPTNTIDQTTQGGSQTQQQDQNKIPPPPAPYTAPQWQAIAQIEGTSVAGAQANAVTNAAYVSANPQLFQGPGGSYSGPPLAPDVAAYWRAVQNAINTAR